MLRRACDAALATRICAAGPLATLWVVGKHACDPSARDPLKTMPCRPLVSSMMNFVPPALEFRLEGLQFRTLFQIGDGAGLGAKMRLVDGLLDVEPPVDQPGEAARHELDDGAAAGRAEHRFEPPLCWNTIVGDIELRGRLPASTRLATGRPASSLARKEKSVSWLLSRKPRTSWKLPKADSMEVVIDTALPPASTIGDMAGRWQWLAVVDAAGEARAGRQTGFGVPIERAIKSIVAARRAR